MPSQIKLEASGHARETDITADKTIHVISFGTGTEETKVEIQVHAVTDTEAVEDTNTCRKLMVEYFEAVMLDKEQSGINIGDEAPNTGLLVAADSIEEIPEQVTV